MGLNSWNRLSISYSSRTKTCLLPMLLLGLFSFNLQWKLGFTFGQNPCVINKTVNSIIACKEQLSTLLNYSSSINFLPYFNPYENDTVVNNKVDTGDSQSLVILDFWPWQLLLILMYSLTAIVSLTLNIVTACVLVRCDKFISTELWKFLVNLSIADIAMALFCIPFTYTDVMLQQWIFPHSLCPIVYFAQFCSIFVSVWTLTVIGIDRYFAIVHPLHLLHWLRSYKLLVIGSIWVIGTLFASTQLFVTRAMPYYRAGKLIYDCRENWPNEFQRKMFTIFIFVLVFAAPVIILAFVYSTISYQILRNVPPGNPDMFRDKRQLNRKIKVLKMLITIVLLFAMCWLPIHLLGLLYDFMPQIMKVRTPTGYVIFYATYFFSHFLSMFHSLINPIVYCFMSENFRSNLWHMVNKFMNRIKNCETVSTTTSENIELDNYFGDEYTLAQTTTLYNSRIHKNLTKVSAIQIEMKEDTNGSHNSNSSTSSSHRPNGLPQTANCKRNGTLRTKDGHQKHLKCHKGTNVHQSASHNNNNHNHQQHNHNHNHNNNLWCQDHKDTHKNLLNVAPFRSTNEIERNNNNNPHNKPNGCCNSDNRQSCPSHAESFFTY